jgi:hypothetical protein
MRPVSLRHRRPPVTRQTLVAVASSPSLWSFASAATLSRNSIVRGTRAQVFTGEVSPSGPAQRGRSLYDTRTVTHIDPTDGVELSSWLDMRRGFNDAPVVVVLPDWNGMHEYEKQRAQMLADLGYVAFAADIYGADWDMTGKTSSNFQGEASKYRTNPELFVSRIQVRGVWVVFLGVLASVVGRVRLATRADDAGAVV